MDIQLLVRKINARRALTALLVAGVAGTSGYLALTQSRAATSATASELENGAITSPASAVDSQGAAGNKAVKFDVASTSVTGLIVSPSGNDSSGNGSANAPYKTFTKAISAATAGTTIYARAGTYNEKFSVTKSGSSGKPITIGSYPGEKAIVVGGAATSYDQPIISLKGISYVTIQDLEVKDITNDGTGITALDSNNIIIKNNVVHNIAHGAINVSGSNITIDNNEVYDACMANQNGAFGSGGWPPAITTKRASNGSSTNINITNNKVNRNWGEGIDAWFLDGGLIEGNRSTNNFAVNIYADESKNLRIINNYVGSDSGQLVPGRKQGVVISSETGAVYPTNMIINGNTNGGGLEEIFVWHHNGVKTLTQSPNPQDMP